MEILAKVFNEMDFEDAWASRGVCRYWYDVFDLVAFGSTKSPLTSIRIGVDAVCAMTSPAGKVMDKHVIHGDLSLKPKRKINGCGNAQLAHWVNEDGRCEYWPRGQWRRHSICDVLTDVKLDISRPLSKAKSISFRPSPPLNGLERDSGPEELALVGDGKFSDFMIKVMTVEESSYNGKMCLKHCVTGLVAPKWQIYALVAHHAKAQREARERLHRHYVQSYYNSFKLVKTKPTHELRRASVCVWEHEWTQLPLRFNIGEIECW